MNGCVSRAMIRSNNKMEHLEIEVKFYLTDIQLIRNRIVELGAESSGRVFETNIRFDDIDNNLLRKNSLLRLRRDTKTTLTFKSEPCVKDDQFKVFNELEVELSDLATMKRILGCLGFRQAQIYEKWRETFLYNGTTLCLDTMPFGIFLEIEGARENIKNNAVEIGLTWDQRITLNYLAIFDIIRHQLRLPFTDVTFNNFKSLNLDLDKFRHLIETDGA